MLEKPASDQRHVSWTTWLHPKIPKTVQIDITGGEQKTNNCEEVKEAILRARYAISTCRSNYSLWTKEDIQLEIYEVQNDMKELLEATLNGDLGAVKEKVGEVTEEQILLFKDSKGRSLLHIASRLEYVDIVELFLNVGISLSDEDGFKGMTVLDYAASVGNLPLIDLLLSHGANVNANTSKIRTALHWAVSSGKLSCVERLVGAGACQSMSGEPESLTPMLLATALGLVDIVRFLLRNGADPHGVQLNSLDSALHIAVEVGSAECVVLLAESGLSMHQRNAAGETALHVAKTSDLASILIERGADVDAMDVDGRTPMYSAVQQGEVTKVEILVRNGGNINTQDKNGDTPLHFGAACGTSRMLRFLLNHGANVTIQNDDGVSAFNSLKSKVPHIMEHVKDSLDFGVTITRSDPLERDCVLVLDFSYVGMIPPPLPENRHSKLLSKAPSYASQLLEGTQYLRNETDFIKSVADSKHKLILTHPLLETFLTLKWQRAHKVFYTNFGFYFTVALVYTVLTMETYMKLCPRTSNANKVPERFFRQPWSWGALPGQSPRVTPVYKLGPQCRVEWQTAAAWYLLVVTTAFALVKEVVKLGQSWRQYVVSVENWGQIVFLVCIILTLYPSNIFRPCDCSSVRTWHYSGAAAGILIAWTMLLIRIGKFPKFGIYVHMLGRVLTNFGRFTVVYVIILNAFALAFCVVLPQEPAFASYLQALLKIFTMMVGELGYDEMFYDSDAMDKMTSNTNGPSPYFSFGANAKELLYPLQTHLLYCVFVAVISISLMNLLVALAVSDIQKIEKEAMVNRLCRLTWSISFFESFLCSKLVRQILPTYLYAHLKTTFLLQPATSRCKFIIRPNSPEDRSIPSELKAKLVEIACSNEEKLKLQNGQEISSTSRRANTRKLEEKLNEIRTQISTFLEILGDQSEQAHDGSGETTK